jgi:8-oxo-dGTP diphosphatase
MKTLNVVAAIVEHDGKILCVRRGPSKHPYIHQKWEFPGGKIEPGEAQTVALLREIREELNVCIDVKRWLMTIEHTYPDFKLIMDMYICSLAKDQSPVNISLNEHIAFTWLSSFSNEFSTLDWAAADLPAVMELARGIRK